MAFKSNLIRHLLGILTPEEISELTSESAGVCRVSLTDLVANQLDGGSYEEFIETNASQTEEDKKESDDDDGKAKILSFERAGGEEAESQKEEIKTLCGDKVSQIMREYVEHCKEIDKNVLGARVRQKRERGKSKENSLFILEQRKRIEKAVTKLRTKEVLDLYSTGSKQEIVKKTLSDSQEENDLMANSKTGVLLNKKIA